MQYSGVNTARHSFKAGLLDYLPSGLLIERREPKRSTEGKTNSKKEFVLPSLTDHRHHAHTTMRHKVTEWIATGGRPPPQVAASSQLVAAGRTQQGLYCGG
jgi:hypothetical protein